MMGRETNTIVLIAIKRKRNVVTNGDSGNHAGDDGKSDETKDA